MTNNQTNEQPAVLVPLVTLEDFVRSVNTLAALTTKAERHAYGAALKHQIIDVIEADAQRQAMKPLGREYKLRMWHAESVNDRAWGAYEWYMQGIEAGEAAHGIKDASMKQLTDGQLLTAFNSCEKVIDGLHAVAELAKTVEAQPAADDKSGDGVFASDALQTVLDLVTDTRTAIAKHASLTVEQKQELNAPILDAMIYLRTIIREVNEALKADDKAGGEPESFEQWNAKQHGDPEEIGFLQALRIAYCSGQDSVYRTRPQPQAIHAGYALVPVEPTPEMVEAIGVPGSGMYEREVWAAMLSAAPKPEKEPGCTPLSSTLI